MPTSRQPIPSSWAAYERGGRAGSADSRTSIQFDDETHHHASSTESAGGHLLPTAGPGRRGSTTNARDMRRRSSFADRVKAIQHAGGPNSLDNFARSWQRAAGFVEVMPVRQSFRYTDEEDEGQGEDGLGYGREEVGSPSPMAQRSLLRQQLEAHEGVAPETVLEEEGEDGQTPVPVKRNLSAAGAAGGGQGAAHSQEQTPLLRHKASRASRRGSESIFQIEPSLASPFGGSYGTTWGSLSSRVNEPAMRHAGRLFRQQQQHGTTEPDKERVSINFEAFLSCVGDHCHCCRISGLGARSPAWDIWKRCSGCSTA